MRKYVDGFIMRALVSWSLVLRLAKVRGAEALVTIGAEKRWLV